MATDLRSLPTRASHSASSPLASHRHQPPATDWLAELEGLGEAPLPTPARLWSYPSQSLLPFSSTPPSLSLVTRAAHPIWTRKDLQNTPASATPVTGGCGQETAEAQSLLSLHIMSRIGSAFVFFNCTHRGTGTVARSSGLGGEKLNGPARHFGGQGQLAHFRL